MSPSITTAARSDRNCSFGRRESDVDSDDGRSMRSTAVSRGLVHRLGSVRSHRTVRSSATPSINGSTIGPGAATTVIRTNRESRMSARIGQHERCHRTAVASDVDARIPHAAMGSAPRPSSSERTRRLATATRDAIGATRPPATSPTHRPPTAGPRRHFGNPSRLDSSRYVPHSHRRRSPHPNSQHRRLSRRHFRRPPSVRHASRHLEVCRTHRTGRRREGAGDAG